MLKIILAGILAIPCLLVAIVAAPLIAILAIPPLLLLIFRKDSGSQTPDHVIIAGGSSGIGFCLAEECVRKGIPKITILARNPKRLEEAKAKLDVSSKRTEQKIDIRTASVSVSDHEALQNVAKNCHIGKEERVILFACAGIPFTTEFEKVPIEKYLELVETNQLGTMYLVRSFLPYIHQGCIVLTSSAAGQVGVYGYSAYSPTKYALRGFAEVMHAELIKSKPQVSIQVAFPVDTDTPGYREEAKMMPEITKTLNETGGLANPEEYVTIHRTLFVRVLLSLYSTGDKRYLPLLLIVCMP